MFNCGVNCQLDGYYIKRRRDRIWTSTYADAGQNRENLTAAQCGLRYEKKKEVPAKYRIQTEQLENPILQHYSRSLQ